MKRILLIQTGGTIAMHLEDRQTRLDPDRFTHLLHKEMPELRKIAEVETLKLFFEDSSDIHPNHWSELAHCLHRNWDRADGFVVLHGTDTMAYTASALSFALQHLSKPVICTGSQIPMSNIRSDARRNLINAVELATLPMNEVAICFNDTLYRGNRSTKISIGDFHAFASPNFLPLADIGTQIELHETWKRTDGDFSVNPLFGREIRLVTLFPGIDLRPLYRITELEAGERPGVVVMEAYGSGNIPMKEPANMLDWIRHCRENDWQVVITSQAVYDSVTLGAYAGGAAAADLGAVSAGDMTLEATITKSMYLLGNGIRGDEFQTQFLTNLRGERSF